jgi:hypothetical protein
VILGDKEGDHQQQDICSKRNKISRDWMRACHRTQVFKSNQAFIPMCLPRDRLEAAQVQKKQSSENTSTLLLIADVLITFKLFVLNRGKQGIGNVGN